MDKIKKEEKVCYNCEYILGQSDISFGLRCKHPENQKEEMLPIVPSPMHNCKYFKNKLTGE
jgi:hypothetical protein